MVKLKLAHPWYTKFFYSLPFEVRNSYGDDFIDLMNDSLVQYDAIYVRDGPESRFEFAAETSMVEFLLKWG